MTKRYRMDEHCRSRVTVPPRGEGLTHVAREVLKNRKYVYIDINEGT
jgi:hypothetical protein